MKVCTKLHISVVLLFSWSVLSSCAPSTAIESTEQPAAEGSQIPLATLPSQPTSAIPAPSMVVTPVPSEADVKKGIQRAIDIYAQAYNENSSELLRQAVDQTNPPFRRFMQTRFDGTQPASQTGRQRSYTVRAILKQRPYGFVLAQIESEGTLSDVTFRQLDGRWVLSEPTEAQIGKRQQVESEHFRFDIYPWLDDINPVIISLMEQARENVRKQLGKVPDQKPLVHIKPIFGVGSPSDPYVQAYYQRDDRIQDRIEIFAPQSYAFGFYDPKTGWEDLLERLLTHEYTHLVNNRSFVPLNRMSDWMVEGLAEYVAENPHKDAIQEAVRLGTIIPIIDLSDSVTKHDLQHLDLLDEDSEVTYGLAYALVAYVVERYGGLDGFWKLAAAYEQAQNLDRALQQAFGVSYTQFDHDWRAWLKATYR
jgi:hypothetical protein